MNFVASQFDSLGSGQAPLEVIENRRISITHIAPGQMAGMTVLNSAQPQVQPSVESIYPWLKCMNSPTYATS